METVLFFLRILLIDFQKTVFHYTPIYLVYPKIGKSLVANEEMFDHFLPTTLMDLLLDQCSIALSNFLSNNLKNSKNIRVRTNNNYNYLIFINIF